MSFLAKERLPLSGRRDYADIVVREIAVDRTGVRQIGIIRDVGMPRLVNALRARDRQLGPLKAETDRQVA